MQSIDWLNDTRSTIIHKLHKWCEIEIHNETSYKINTFMLRLFDEPYLTRDELILAAIQVFNHENEQEQILTISAKRITMAKSVLGRIQLNSNV